METVPDAALTTPGRRSAPLDDERAGMETYVVPGEHPGMPARLRLVADAAAVGTSRHPDPISLEVDERVRLRKGVAVPLLPSLALWLLIWFALTCLISNWQ
jgi:hypothetical protein